MIPLSFAGYGISFFIFVFLSLVGPFNTNAYSISLEIKKANPLPEKTSKSKRPGQVPHTRIGFGNKNISAAWFAGATSRYKHGILGDTIEASKLIAETTDGHLYQVTLPDFRVFEDLEPRLVDLNDDKKDEIIVIVSDTALGASLAVYGVKSKRLVLIASTPFIGRRNRWLNPVGVGDFDGNGQSDIALIVTPHIGGILRLYQFNDSRLSQYAEHSGVSNHKIGSMELGLGVVVETATKDLLLLPDQAHRNLLLFGWTDSGLMVLTRVELVDRLRTSLKPVGKDRWHFQLENGQFCELRLKE